MTDCILWPGPLNANGYGYHTRKPDIRRLAHRVAWIRAIGPIPDGLCVLHRCDVRPCINVDHLFLGTRAENVRDCARKGRTPNGKSHWAAKLDGEDVRWIRKLAEIGRMMHKEIAACFGVSRSSVTQIALGTSRKEVW